MQGLDSHALVSILRDHHRLIFAVLEDGRIDKHEAELLIVTLSAAAAEKASQGKSVEQIAGELASRVMALLADVFTTDAAELEQRHKAAMRENDLQRAARLAVRLDKHRGREERREERQQERETRRAVRQEPEPEPELVPDPSAVDGLLRLPEPEPELVPPPRPAPAPVSNPFGPRARS